MTTKTQFRCLAFSLIAFILCLLLAVLFSNQIKLIKTPITKQWIVNELTAGEHYTVDVNDSPKLVSDLKRLAVDLDEIQRTLINYATPYHRLRKQIDFLHGIIKSFGGEIAKENQTSPVVGSPSSDSSAPKQEVCPEKFMGTNQRYGYPFYRTGFGRVNCTEFVPINQLVTILVTLPGERSTEEQQQVFQDIAKYYPNIPIVLASTKKLSEDMVTKLKLNLKNIVSSDLMHGETWSKLLQEVTTPYVLFAPDITHFTDDVNLERLVRVLSNNKETIIAGGSYKNLRGEWERGCLQVTFRSWTAFFRGGYYRSIIDTDCIVCDVLPGPFMAKVEGLKQIGIDGKLPFGVFQDLFWRLKLKHPDKVVVTCPDVMFDTYVREIPDPKYVALTQKWNVKKWVESDGRVRWYGCRRGYSHTSSKPCGNKKGLALPPCDMENLADAIKFTMKACEDAGVYCELHEGSNMGAVKFQNVLPWELDADIKFLSENYTALRNLRSRFEAAGFRFSDEEGTKCCTDDGRKTNGIILAFRDGWKVELYGKHMLESELLVASGQRPTKVKIAGEWVTAMRNPGLNARNRYGPNIYRHSQHWLQVGLSFGWAKYNPGSFTKCPEPGHSACLDQFPAEGDFQFTDYPPV